MWTKDSFWIYYKRSLGNAISLLQIGYSEKKMGHTLTGQFIGYNQFRNVLTHVSANEKKQLNMSKHLDWWRQLAVILTSRRKIGCLNHVELDMIVGCSELFRNCRSDGIFMQIYR